MLCIIHKLEIFLYILQIYSIIDYGFCAEPLRIPLRKSSYTFDLHLKWTTSMTDSTTEDDVQILVWDVERASYARRVKEESEPCNAFEFLTNPDDYDVIPFDGLHNRIIGINGKSPGDPIVVHKGSKVALRVFNELTENDVSIHVHGSNQLGTWFMDGAAHVQQCPIPTDSVWTYRFTADEAGTFFIHGHLGTDRARGLNVPFIVVDQAEPDQADIEYAMTLQDCVPIPSPESFLLEYGNYQKFYYGLEDRNKCWVRTTTYDGSEIGSSNPSTIVFNMKGWYIQNDVLTRPHQLNLEEYEIEPGQRVKFRLIAEGRNEPMMVSIQFHRLEVVAIDGSKIKPVLVDMIIVYPGERYDFVVVGKQNPSCTEYHILAENLQSATLVSSEPLRPIFGIAFLEYENIYGEESLCPLPDWEHTTVCSNSNPCVVLNCPWGFWPGRNDFKCINLGDIQSAYPMPSEMAKNYYSENELYSEKFLNFNADYLINGHSFLYPRAPPYANPDGAGSIWVPCSYNFSRPPDNVERCMYTVNAAVGSTLQLIIYNMGFDPAHHHPLHIHGKHFYVIKQGFAPQDPVTGLLTGQNRDIKECSEDDVCANQSWSNYRWLNGNVGGANLINPVLKDTVVVPSNGYVVLRLKTDNPGYWIAHCHIMMHHLKGMAFVLKVGQDSQMPKPPKNSPFMNACGIYDPANSFTKDNAGNSF